MKKILYYIFKKIEQNLINNDGFILVLENIKINNFFIYLQFYKQTINDETEIKSIKLQSITIDDFYNLNDNEINDKFILLKTKPIETIIFTLIKNITTGEENNDKCVNFPKFIEIVEDKNYINYLFLKNSEKIDIAVQKSYWSEADVSILENMAKQCYSEEDLNNFINILEKHSLSNSKKDYLIKLARENIKKYSEQEYEFDM